MVALGEPRPHALLAAAVLVGWGLAVWGLLGLARAPRGGLPAGVLIAAALLVRVPLLVLDPVYSDDVYRYVWEGAVWRAGMNPFALAPDAAALAPLRDEIWAQVNHREVSSIYPPLAQLLSVLLPGTLAWKITMGAADVVTAALLHRREPRAGWLWALLPLPALESAGSGHLEGVGVCLMVAALAGRPWAAWAGALVKLLPGVLLVPLVGRRWRWWIGGITLGLVTFSPILLAGEGAWRGFETYRATWAYNGSLYPLLCLLLEEPTARRVLQLSGIIVAAGILVRSRDPGRVAVWVTGAFVILSPTVHPWYALWPFAAALWTRTRAWEAFAVLVPLAYVVLGSHDAEASAWVEPVWPRVVIYPVFYGLLLWGAWVRMTRPGPAPVH